MKSSKIYKCKKCGSILVLPAENWMKKMECTVCGNLMSLLDDDWDLSEIISSEEDEENDIEKIHSK